jgi:hypothetical protein
MAPFDKDTLDGLTAEGLSQNIYEQAMAVYAQREKSIGPDTLRHLERVVMLQTVDNLWKDHLLSMDHLKEGIGLRGYAQQNPLHRLQERRLRHVPGPHRAHQGRDHRHHVPHPTGRTHWRAATTFCMPVISAKTRCLTGSNGLPRLWPFVATWITVHGPIHCRPRR